MDPVSTIELPHVEGLVGVVRQRIFPTSQIWDAAKLSHKVLAIVILKIPLPQEPVPDTKFWGYEPDGNFSVRSAYKLATGFFN